MEKYNNKIKNEYVERYVKEAIENLDLSANKKPLKISIEIEIDHMNNSGYLEVNGNRVELLNTEISEYSISASDINGENFYLEFPGIYKTDPDYLSRIKTIRELKGMQFTTGDVEWIKGLYGFDIDKDVDWREEDFDFFDDSDESEEIDNDYKEPRSIPLVEMEQQFGIEQIKKYAEESYLPFIRDKIYKQTPEYYKNDIIPRLERNIDYIRDACTNYESERDRGWLYDERCAKVRYERNMKELREREKQLQDVKYALSSKNEVPYETMKQLEDLRY